MRKDSNKVAMLSKSLDGEFKEKETVQSTTGLLPTHGAPPGEKMDSSESRKETQE